MKLLRPSLRRVLLGASWVYLALLFFWLALYVTTVDRIGYVGLVNLLAVYLFAPLPLVAIAALAWRQRTLGTGVLLGILVFGWFWGGLFLPRPATPTGDEPPLRVMTFNVLATHNQWQPLVETIRAARADVVFIQELNPVQAAELQSALAEIYPYAVLDPRPNAFGIGTLSRFPLHQAQGSRALPDGAAALPWIGGPQVLEMDFQGERISLVNFHMLSTPRVRSPAAITHDFRNRDTQARALVEIAARNGSTILGGDANSVPLSSAYQILSSNLTDAWQEAGFGLGHTFPSRSTVPGSDRVQIGGWYVPPWLARIDYIFHTDHWQTVSAELAQIDGVSDHRGLVVELVRRVP